MRVSQCLSVCLCAANVRCAEGAAGRRALLSLLEHEVERLITWHNPQGLPSMPLLPAGAFSSENILPPATWRARVRRVGGEPAAGCDAGSTVHSSGCQRGRHCGTRFCYFSRSASSYVFSAVVVFVQLVREQPRAVLDVADAVVYYVSERAAILDLPELQVRLSRNVIDLHTPLVVHCRRAVAEVLVLRV